MPILNTVVKKFNEVDIGSMDNRIFIYDRAITPPIGLSLNFTETFTAKLECWAAIETTKGVEIFDQSNISRGIASHRFYIRNIPYAALINTPVFSGTGLNDLSSSGSYTYTSKLTYLVQIDSVGIIAGSHDTFIWSSDGGVTWSTRTAIAGAAQLLSNGVSIIFAHTQGHTLGDSWSIVATAGIRITAQDWIFYQNQFMGVQSIFDILTVETLNQEGRYLSLLATLTGDQSVPANYA
jgi:hypothetical protein